MRAAVGKRLRELRKSRALTQVQLAEKASLNVKYYAACERTGANLTIDSLERLADALGVAVADLFPAHEDGGPDDRQVVLSLAQAVTKSGDADKVRRLRAVLENFR